MARYYLPLLLLLLAFTLLGCGAQPSSDPSGFTAGGSVRPLPTPGTVTATAHPLVAKYSVFVPYAGQAIVEFGPDANYGRRTQTQTLATAGTTVMFLVAGMRAGTTYHMRARVDLDDGNTLVDSDHPFTTGALPNASFPSVTVTPPGGLTAGAGVDLISSIGVDVGAVVMDTDGAVIWYYYDPNMPGAFPFPIRQLENGDYLITFENDVREVDLTGRMVRDVTLDQLNAALSAAGYPFQAGSFHHDALRLSKGHWILLVNEGRDFQDLPGYPGTTTVSGDDLVDLDTNNQVVWAWRAFDHLDINRHPFLFPDWTHSNAIVYTPDRNLLLSVRHQSWILKIDYANGAGSGDILWRLGPEGDFTLSSSDPAQWFYNQHFPVLLQTTGSQFRLALYDNGDLRPDSTGQPCLPNNTCYSRAIIMDVNEAGLAANVSWQYSPGWFSYWGGSIVKLSNGDIEFDSSSVNSGYSQVTEVTPGPNPQVVWQMGTSNANFYRAYRIPSLYPEVRW